MLALLGDPIPVVANVGVADCCVCVLRRAA